VTIKKRRVEFDREKILSIVSSSGSTVAINQGDERQQGKLLEGNFMLANLGCLLSIHTTDAIALDNIESSFALPGALTISLLLSGSIEAQIDGQDLNLSSDNGASGLLWSHSQPAQLSRRSIVGQRVRKVNITINTHELKKLYRNDLGGEFTDSLAALIFTKELQILPWQPANSSVRCAEDILAMGNNISLLDKLSTNIWALHIVHDALQQCESAAQLHSTGLNARDVERARLAEQYIIANLTQDIHLSDIAKATAMSVSTLQRVFKGCRAVTVMEFMRTKRLENARLAISKNGMPVSQAAYEAKYTSAANFSTAFLREFGYTPSSCVSSL